MEKRLPAMGFGVYKAGADVYEAVRLALEVGYRHIDCAPVYGNEEAVGRAIADSGLPREALFVTTKLWPTEFARAEASLDESLSRLGLSQVDAYLLHWPGLDAPLRHRAWEEICRLAERGLVGRAGVSNFLPVHLAQLAQAGLPKPWCNQLERHPWFPQTAARRYCRDHGIAVVCWAPIFRGRGEAEPVLQQLALRHGKSPAQIVLRWHLERGDHPIPKSVTPQRIRENFDVLDFTLTPGELAQIDTLETGEHVGRDPMTYGG